MPQLGRRTHPGRCSGNTRRLQQDTMWLVSSCENKSDEANAKQNKSCDKLHCEVLHCTSNVRCVTCGASLVIAWDRRERCRLVTMRGEESGLHVPAECSQGCYSLYWHQWRQLRRTRVCMMEMVGPQSAMCYLQANSNLFFEYGLMVWIRTLFSFRGVPFLTLGRTVAQRARISLTPSAQKRFNEDLECVLLLLCFLVCLSFAKIAIPTTYIEETQTTHPRPEEKTRVPLNLRKQRDRLREAFRQRLPDIRRAMLHAFVVNHAAICPSENH